MMKKYLKIANFWPEIATFLYTQYGLRIRVFENQLSTEKPLKSSKFSVLATLKIPLVLSPTWFILSVSDIMCYYGNYYGVNLKFYCTQIHSWNHRTIKVTISAITKRQFICRVFGGGKVTFPRKSGFSKGKFTFPRES